MSEAAAQAQAQTITPERQIAAQQVGAVFNSLHEYLRTIEPKDPEGRSTLTKQLEFAHQRVDEAAMWAIKSVLTFGIPPRQAPPAAAPADAAANETPAPIGTVDAAPPVADVASPAADVPASNVGDAIADLAAPAADAAPAESV
jgi:hypothetical protein